MPTKQDDGRAQRERFIAMAKELGCNPSEEAFRANLTQIAKAPPVENPRGQRANDPKGKKRGDPKARSQRP